MSVASLGRLFLLAAIWGASFLFIRIGVPALGTAGLVVLRVALGALLLCGVALFLRKPLVWRGRLRFFLIAGSFNAGLPFVLYAFAAHTLNASMLAIINATTPIWGAIVAAIWLRAPLTRTVIAGLATGFVGVLFIVGSSAGTHGGDWWLAVFAALCAPICYAIATSYARLYAQGISSLDQAHGSLWAATLVVLPLLAANSTVATPDMQDWLAVIALGLACTGWAYMLFFRLIEDIGPARTLTVTFLIPVFGVLWGAVFLGEAVTPSMIGGGLVVLLGTALANGLIGKRPPAG
jgi:drug/metabolite transporter (DMT)-like permease